ISASKPRSRNRCRNTTELPPSPYVPITSGSTSPIRTVESDTSGPPECSVQLQEGGVVGDDLDVSRRAGRDGFPRVGHQSVFDAGLSEAHAQVFSALAARHDRMVDEVLEVDV